MSALTETRATRPLNPLIASKLVTAAQVDEAAQVDSIGEFELRILAASLGLSWEHVATHRDFLEELWLCAYTDDDDTDYLRTVILEDISMDASLLVARRLLDVFQDAPIESLPRKFRLHLGQQAGGDLTAMNFAAKTAADDARADGMVERISKNDPLHARAIAAERLGISPQGLGNKLKRHRDRLTATQLKRP